MEKLLEEKKIYIFYAIKKKKGQWVTLLKDLETNGSCRSPKIQFESNRLCGSTVDDFLKNVYAF